MDKVLNDNLEVVDDVDSTDNEGVEARGSGQEDQASTARDTGEQARLNSNSIIMMLVFLLTVLRGEEAGQCITEFSGTGRRIKCNTEIFVTGLLR